VVSISSYQVREEFDKTYPWDGTPGDVKRHCIWFISATHNSEIQRKESLRDDSEGRRDALASRKIIVNDAIAGGVNLPPSTGGGYLCVSTLMMNM
jgi:hypothetical protein